MIKRNKTKLSSRKTFTIYMATSKTTGRSYIGCTGLNLAQRIANHESAANPSPNVKTRISTSPFHMAIRQLGIDDFTWTVLDESDDENFAREVLEPSYIDLHGAYRKGYNATKGGRGKKGYIPSTDHRKKIAISMDKRKASGWKQVSDLTGYRTYTNGITDKKVAPGRKAPKGFVRGTKRNKQLMKSLNTAVQQSFRRSNDWNSLMSDAVYT